MTNIHIDVFGGRQSPTNPGLDYVYNLQGWIKGVNSNTLVQTRDPGKDGHDGTSVWYKTSDKDVHAFFARDAFGYSLTYFDGDYLAVSEPSQSYNFVAEESSVSNLSLYNGNISRMITVLSDTAGETLDIQQNRYKYDQLNRIASSNVFTDTSVVDSNKWVSPVDSGNYETAYSYDGNGNLLTLNRNGVSDSTSLGMDSLSYHYYAGTNQLEYVDDAVAAGNYANDIDDQAAANYLYDASGNLVKDIAEEIDTVLWNVGGKITHIKRTSGSDKPGLEFRYDAGGNRLCKIVKDSTDEVDWRYTYYLRDAQGNPLAIYNKSYAQDTANSSKYYEYLVESEYPIYGSSRLGIARASDTISVHCFTTAGFDSETGAFLNKQGCPGYSKSGVGVDSLGVAFTRAKKEYELSDHTGTPKVIISDRKIAVADSGDPDSVSHYLADVLSTMDNYPFGMMKPRLVLSLGNGYRYGFNGMEKDDKVKGYGNSLDFGARIYDSRIGRWLSKDPLETKYPFLNPYNFVSNTPIIAVDPDGREIVLHYRDENGKKLKIKLKTMDDFNDLRSVKNQYVEDFVKAVDYLRTNQADQNIVENLIVTKEKVHLKNSSEYPKGSRTGSFYTPKFKTIFWDNKSGAAYGEVGGELQKNTPAFVLLSEVAKAYYIEVEGQAPPTQHKLDVLLGDITINRSATDEEVKKWKKDVEGIVSDNIEFPAANTLIKAGYQEGIRTSISRDRIKFEGTKFYRTKSVTSTAPADEKSSQKINNLKRKLEDPNK